MTRYLVTGASGLLGLNFGLELAGQGEVVGVANRHALASPPFRLLTTDLSQPGSAARLLDEAQPDVVVNCAAMAILDECEANPALAEQVNAIMPGELARAARERDVRMVHISTDSVFDGQRGDYTEEDAPNPLSTYSRTKVAGEQAVAEANPDAIIARVVFYGWSLSGRRSLSEFFYNRMSAGQTATGFTDVFFCPLQVNDLAQALARMAGLGLSGLYHVVGPRCLSKHDFGVALAREFGFDPGLVIPTSVMDSALKAPRSPRLCLRSDKVAAALGGPLPGLEHGLGRLRAQLLDGYVERVRGMAAPV